jgi:hypothetical protein
MAQTDTRPGFKLPWTPDRTDNDALDDGANSATASVDPPPAEEPVTPDMIDTTTPAPARRPTKFMADLSRAMQTAVETSRDETMARFIADSKVIIEEIQAASTVEAASLRLRADDDVAAIREWSKAEIAQIREETETRIAARKAALDNEMDAHAAVVEARVATVGSSVEQFQQEMDAFFERLLAEQDPTRIATMAETMPDPPDLAGVAASITEPSVGQSDPPQVGLADAPVMLDPEPEVHVEEAAPDPAAEQAAEAEAAMAARFDFAAAEAEALAFTGDLDDENGSVMSPPQASAEDGTPPPDTAEPASSATDDTIGAQAGSTPTGRLTSRVVVVGLVSVASIATFKRGLSRSAGVTAVGVASGPDGEFVFTIKHESDLDLASTVTGLPGFEARVTAESAGTLEVVAHDPDSGD